MKFVCSGCMPCYVGVCQCGLWIDRTDKHLYNTVYSHYTHTHTHTHTHTLHIVLFFTVQKTVCCNSTSNAPDDGQMYLKHVELRIRQ